MYYQNLKNGKGESMVNLESLREELSERAKALRKKGFTQEEMERELLHFLMEQKRKQEFTIPELEELVTRSKEISSRLSEKVERLKGLSGAA